jgi:hypothetical protein
MVKHVYGAHINLSVPNKWAGLLDLAEPIPIRYDGNYMIVQADDGAYVVRPIVQGPHGHCQNNSGCMTHTAKSPFCTGARLLMYRLKANTQALG